MSDTTQKTSAYETPTLTTHDELLYAHTFEGKMQSTSPIPVLPQLSVALGILVFVFSVTYIGASKFAVHTNDTNEFRVETTANLKAGIEDTTSAHVFDNTKVIAESAFVWDVQNQKILFNKNGDEELPLASITKLMTALVAYELLDPEDTVRISNESLKTSGDSGFVDGEEFSMRNLTDLVLISSSNDGATALGAAVAQVIGNTNEEEIFVTAMNHKAKQLGLTNTTFKNTTGLDISETVAGAYGSARDIALLMEYIITHKPDAIALTSLSTTKIFNDSGDFHTAKNTNEVVDDIEGLIASKTGYTELAGGNLVTAFNAGLNRPIIVVVLGSSQDGRFTDTLTLINKARLIATLKSE